jgi:hypothetical protein
MKRIRLLLQWFSYVFNSDLKDHEEFNRRADEVRVAFGRKPLGRSDGGEVQ